MFTIEELVNQVTALTKAREWAFKAYQVQHEGVVLEIRFKLFGRWIQRLEGGGFITSVAESKSLREFRENLRSEVVSIFESSKVAA